VALVRRGALSFALSGGAADERRGKRRAYRRQAAARIEVGSSPDKEGLYKTMKRLGIE
jgi:hypothetical protein